MTVRVLWAVTKSLGNLHQKRGHIWLVTHIPSGASTNRFPTTKKEARRIARLFGKTLTGPEWREMTHSDQMTTVMREQARAVLKGSR